jgi:methylmalonyl-CoA/ethylmalonyl-CoA epimerase
VIEYEFFGEGARFEHIGVAVKSIERISPGSEVTTDPVQKVSVAFVSVHGMELELIEPSGDDSPVMGSLRKGVKWLHLCYAVPDIDAAIAECRNHGFHCIARPVPAAAFEQRRIAWVYSSEYGLFELLEDSKDL